MVTKKAKCPICGKVFEGKYSDGSLRLHLLKGHAAKVQSKEKEVPPKEKTESEKKWRWLDKSNPRELKAYKMGYLEISEEGELR